MLGPLVFLLFVSSTLARTSSNAEYIKNRYMKDGASRISNDYYLDAILDVPDLIARYNYTCEVHYVETSDGYILEMHRIPHGRDANNTAGQRPVAFLMHGLTLSSAHWVILGPGTALAYILAESGFDVWMGNARGNYYSRNHTTLNPDNSRDFWDFSWHEVGVYDMPAMIDYTLNYTGEEKVHYIGHSQGTTTFFVMAAMKPELNSKIKTAHAYSPISYMGNSVPLIQLLTRAAIAIHPITSLLGLNEWFGASDLLSKFLFYICSDGAPLHPVCTGMIYLAGGYSPEQLNKTMYPTALGHYPGGTSAKQFVHYAQSCANSDFRQYDRGLLGNLFNYGQFRAPKYSLSSITSPVYHKADRFAAVADVEILYEELGGPKSNYSIPTDYFGHMDYIWGVDPKTLLYDYTISILLEYENNSTRNSDD